MHQRCGVQYQTILSELSVVTDGINDASDMVVYAGSCVGVSVKLNMTDLTDCTVS